MTTVNDIKVAIIGVGNIGRAMALGIHQAVVIDPSNVYLTRRKTGAIQDFAPLGFQITTDNQKAVSFADIIVVAVTPAQMPEVMEELSRCKLTDKIIASAVSGIRLENLKQELGEKTAVVRIMPNTAAALGQSITCLAALTEDEEALTKVEELMGYLGETLRIDEEQMSAATALGACGVAFFLRAVRAASQGGIQAGFHAEEALMIAAQTARGAAELIRDGKHHPEFEIDKVTTPQGATISGLNEMEHAGFSSAFIKGIVCSAEKIGSFSQTVKE